MNAAALPVYMTSLRLSQLLGQPVGEVEAAIKRLEIQPTMVKGVTEYYIDDDLKKIRNEALVAQKESA